MRRVLWGNVAVGMQLAQPVYGLNGQVVLNTGAKLTGKHIAKLQEMDVGYIYVEGESELIDPNDQVAQAAKDAIVLSAHQVLDKVSVGKYVETNTVKAKAVAFLKDCCMYKNIQPMFVAMQNCNDYLFKHAVSGYFFAVMLGMSKGLEDQRLRELGLGALLRDVGMVTISRDIINKPGALTPDEMAVVKKHPEKGFELLQRNSDISLAAANCALQHHERYNGSGYPRGLGQDRIHEFAQITAITDVYSSMTANTPYRKALSVYDTLAIIGKTGAAYFYPELVTMLTANVVAYRVGTVVRFNNRWTGTIEEHADEFKTKPIVKVTMDEQGGRMNKKITMDFAVDPNLYICEVL